MIKESICDFGNHRTFEEREAIKYSPECNEGEFNVLAETESNTIHDLPLLTRYLYLSYDVYYSLLRSLSVSPETKEIFTESSQIEANRKYESIAEILFWTYELYFSGFKEKTILLFREINDVASSENEGLHRSEAEVNPHFTELAKINEKIMCKLFQEYDEYILKTNGGCQNESRMKIHPSATNENENLQPEDIEKEALLVANIAVNLKHKITFYQNTIPKKNKNRCMIRISYDTILPFHLTPLHFSEEDPTKVVTDAGFNILRSATKENSIDCDGETYLPQNDGKTTVTLRSLVETPKVKHYNVLRMICLYESYKCFIFQDEIFAKDKFDELRKEISNAMYESLSQPINNWLYYCYNTPIWKERITMHKGTVNHELKTITFDEENMESFCEKYDYEPDSNMFLIKFIVG
jgi:hypothetical protein